MANPSAYGGLLKTSRCRVALPGASQGEAQGNNHTGDIMALPQELARRAATESACLGHDELIALGKWALGLWEVPDMAKDLHAAEELESAAAAEGPMCKCALAYRMLGTTDPECQAHEWADELNERAMRLRRKWDWR